MAQNPLPPPPPSGGVLDGWLYLLWRRLTQAGQILWESITPGTSADVAAVVTDETGSPGSLVFSGNPTLAGVTNSGNLVFTGTGNRITGDFSNATIANRVIFQSTTTNGNTFVPAMPNGTGTIAGFGFYNANDPDNASFLSLSIQSTQAVLASTKTGTGSYLDLNFQVSGTTKATIAADGVVTLGGAKSASALKIIPDATPSTQRRVEITAGSSTGNPTIGVSGGNLAIAGTAEVSGNLVFTGTGTRIIGDFSNATFSNRAMWQTSTADSSTTLGIIPNGTGPNGTLNLYNNSDPTNAGRLALTCGTGEAAIFSTIHGSGTYVPLGVYVNNVETARFALNGVNTFGGASTAPALKVTPVASQARWIEVTGATSSTNPTIGVSGGNLATSAVFMPVQATTAGAPAYVLGGMYFDTTLNKLRIGGATAWETVTSL